MKSKKIIIAFIALLFANILVHAQDTDEKKFKHEFGFDASRILNGIFQTSNFNGIMYRYHTKNGSLRVRANVDYGHSPSQTTSSSSSYFVSGYTNTNTSIATRDKQYNLNSQLRVGWQWVKGSNNISAYMGEDVILGMVGSHSGRTDESYSDDKYTTSVSKNINNNSNKGYTYGLSSFGGVIFKLNSRLRLTIETSIDIYMTSTKNTSEDSRNQSTTYKTTWSVNTTSTANSANIKDNTFYMNFIPLNMFMLSVMF